MLVGAVDTWDHKTLLIGVKLKKKLRIAWILDLPSRVGI